MKKLFILLCSLCILFSYKSTSYAYDVVDTNHQKYSYEEMQQDLVELSSGHEDFCTVESGCITSQGREVYLVKLGNPNASRKILVTASIHAREYMSTQLVMKMLEEYVLHYDKYKADFDNICFYIVPMVNPDGVMISQQGINSAKYESTKNWLNGFKNLEQIKSNVNGVDLNRNFPVGFGHVNNSSLVSYAPSLYYYAGSYPLSEVETKYLDKLLQENEFSAGINYHSQGNIIYWGSTEDSKENISRQIFFSTLAKNTIGYRLAPDDDTSSANGSFGDYFSVTENAPYVTIEIGNRNPVPINQFNNIYKHNSTFWSVVANTYKSIE